LNALHPAAHELPETLPSRPATLLFRAKAVCFQARRFCRDLAAGGIRRHRPGDRAGIDRVIGEWASALWSEGAAPRERRLQLGKVQNLRVAARALDGMHIPAGEIFSFWRELGRPTRRRGYAEGRELREGCLIPTLGGGLCQLSGALYNAALAAGLEIVERHAHSHAGVGSLAQIGRDATVFWNYVDLRLRADVPWRIEVSLTCDQLLVRIRGGQAPARRDCDRGALTLAPRTGLGQPNSCATCGIGSCFRHQAAVEIGVDRQAALLDEWQPEWQAYFEREDFRSALLCRPLDGRRFRKANYLWDESAFGQATDATFTTLRRAWAIRGLREQGAARQRALLDWDERLARALASKLRAEHSHLVVAQNLLPYLWRDGVLGGRTFDVLMVRPPLEDLQRALDHASALHPDSRTCADFRAQADLLAAEAEALAAADRWITPHAHLAALGGARSVRLPWEVRRRGRALRGGERIAFPASTLCRKGAYELREAARALDLEVVCLGGFLEGADFWSGVRLAEPSPDDWLTGIAAVVLPAFVENRPRRLLEAVAAGVPVVASPECGLGAMRGVTEVAAGDADGLIGALHEILESRAAILKPEAVR
jgi:VanW like protein